MCFTFNVCLYLLPCIISEENDVAFKTSRKRNSSYLENETQDFGGEMQKMFECFGGKYMPLLFIYQAANLVGFCASDDPRLWLRSIRTPF